MIERTELNGNVELAAIAENLVKPNGSFVDGLSDDNAIQQIGEINAATHGNEFVGRSEAVDFDRQCEPPKVGVEPGRV